MEKTELLLNICKLHNMNESSTILNNCCTYFSSCKTKKTVLDNTELIKYEQRNPI